MQKEFKNLLKILIAFIVVLLFFSAIRVYFYFSNQSLFTGNIHLLKAFLLGLFYDFRFILWINSPVFFLFFFPFRIRNTLFWQGIVRILFLVINFSFLLFYLFSAKFYSVLSDDFLSISESNNVIPALFKSVSQIRYNFFNSWDLLLFAAFAFIVLWQIFPSINNLLFERTKKNKLSRYALSFLGIIILFWGFYVHRFQTEKWQSSLFQYENRPTVLLSINSGYQLLHLYLDKTEEFYGNKNDAQSADLFSVHKAYVSSQGAKSNLFLANIYLNGISFDEFIKKIKAFGFSYHLSNNFYATHKLKLFSKDELFLSFPEFMNKPLYQTKFAFNNFQSIADILRKNNYHTIWISNRIADKQMKAEKNFYGFEELITDEEPNRLLDKLSETIDKSAQDYFVFIDFKGDFSEILNFLSDKYFNKNALIVLNIKQSSKKDFDYGKIIFLLPENSSKITFYTDTLSDLDIFPSIIDYLGIKNEFVAFGKSIFKKHEKVLFQYTGNDYILINDSLLLRYNGKSTKWLINYQKDPDEYYDLQDEYPVQKVEMENRIRAIISEYKKQLRIY
ncbi:MAG: hypothetical protein L3J74_12425 [Bacteroidales bacterium]|nr:hypothetical protein [Bacteroidales bacterium]